MSDYVKQRLAEIAAREGLRKPVQKPRLPPLIQRKREASMTTITGTTMVEMGLNDNGCGHTIVMGDEHYKACKETKRTWYCTICGLARAFGGKSTVDQLRGDLAAAKQREETERHNRRLAEEKLAKEIETNARLKKRAKGGVCPCCTRTFTNMARHMKTKHPEFKS